MGIHSGNFKCCSSHRFGQFGLGCHGNRRQLFGRAFFGTDRLACDWAIPCFSGCKSPRYARCSPNRGYWICAPSGRHILARSGRGIRCAQSNFATAIDELAVAIHKRRTYFFHRWHVSINAWRNWLTWFDPVRTQSSFGLRAKQEQRNHLVRHAVGHLSEAGRRATCRQLVWLIDPCRIAAAPAPLVLMSAKHFQEFCFCPHSHLAIKSK